MPKPERISDPANPLAVYINVPFCTTACSFCHYRPNLRFGNDSVPSDYLEALQRQWTMILDLFPAGRPLVSLYLGGGTPSLLSGKQFDRLLTPLEARGVTAEERTLEIHPATWPRLIGDARQALAGFNRFSIGVQTFDAERLRHWSREVYGFREIDAIISALRGLRPDAAINMDLLFETAVNHTDLRLAAAVAPDSITLYPRTGRRPPGGVTTVYACLREAAETLSDYRRLSPRSFIFLRRWNARSRHAVHEYEAAGDVIGLGHMAVSHLGNDSFRSRFDGSDCLFEPRRQGARYRVGVLRAIPYGVAPDLVEAVDPGLFAFLEPHPDVPDLRYLRPGAAVDFDTFLTVQGWAIDDIEEFRRTVAFGDTAPDRLKEVTP